MATEQQLDPAKLRNAAGYLEDTALEALTRYEELSFAPVVGGLQYFPRSSPDYRAAAQGFEYLREDVHRTVAVLHALAVARDHRLTVPPALALVARPYLELYEASRPPGREAHEGDDAGDLQTRRAE